MRAVPNPDTRPKTRRFVSRSESVIVPDNRVTTLITVSGRYIVWTTGRGQTYAFSTSMTSPV